MKSGRLRIATRSSPLARWQAERVAALLRSADPELEVSLVELSTHGDRRQDLPITALGGQGVFVKEVQQAVLEDRADLAVHSAKDLPSLTAEGLCLAAFPERADARDVLVGTPLEQIAGGGTVATGSVRRRAQLAARRADLCFVNLRGNIATRLGKVPEGGALVMAKAALDRLDLGHLAAQVLAVEEALPQVGQGAIAVECRADASGVIGILAGIDQPEVRVAVEAERAFLARLGSGCDLPVAAHALRLDTDRWRVDGMIASPDGTRLLKDRRVAREPEIGGQAVALAEQLLSDGGAELLGV